MTTEKDTPEGYAFYVREFLNKPGEHSTAFIYATVTVDGYAELTMSDCSRQISFALDDMYGSKFGNVDNCINKLDIMIKTLKGLRLAYIAGSKKRGWKPKNQRKEDE